MRILHFADIHFGMENYGRLDPKTGLHSRFGDFLKSYHAVIDYAISQKVDAVLFAGDAFKTRDPSPTYVRAFAEGIRKIAEAKIPVVMVVGNHDLPNATGKANTLDIFTALAVPNVSVSREPERIVVATKSGPLQVVTLPWMYRSQLFSRDEFATRTGEELQRLFQEKVIELFRLRLAKVDPKIPAVALVHASVEGATFGSERAVMLGSDIVVPLKVLTDQRLDYIAVGHIHKYQLVHDKPPIAYSGSIERIDFSEENEPKGFIMVQIKREGLKRKTATQFVKTPARPFKTIYVDIHENDPDPTQTVVTKVNREDVADVVVRVVIRCNEAKALGVREMPIRDALVGAHFIAGITKQVAHGQRVAEEEGFSDELLSAAPLDALEEFFRKRDMPRARIAKLKEIARDLIEEVEAI